MEDPNVEYFDDTLCQADRLFAFVSGIEVRFQVKSIGHNHSIGLLVVLSLSISLTSERHCVVCSCVMAVVCPIELLTTFPV